MHINFCLQQKNLLNIVLSFILNWRDIWNNFGKSITNLAIAISAVVVFRLVTKKTRYSYPSGGSLGRMMTMGWVRWKTGKLYWWLQKPERALSTHTCNNDWFNNSYKNKTNGGREGWARCQTGSWGLQSVRCRLGQAGNGSPVREYGQRSTACKNEGNFVQHIKVV